MTIGISFFPLRRACRLLQARQILHVLVQASLTYTDVKSCATKMTTLASKDDTQ